MNRFSADMMGAGGRLARLRIMVTDLGEIPWREMWTRYWGDCPWAREKSDHYKINNVMGSENGKLKEGVEEVTQALI